MIVLPFDDRAQAGRLLAEELSARDVGQDAMVLALTRGGVPIGAVVADRLGLVLDVVVVRKIGVPWQPELAMGAIAGSELILDEQLIGELNISDRDVQEVVAHESALKSSREKLYRGGAPALDPQGRTVILIDDGLATGSTMLAALRHVQSMKPARLIVAVPVGSAEACDRLRAEVVCLATPEPFLGVGRWYRDFRQVDDAEVCSLLARNRQAQK